MFTLFINGDHHFFFFPVAIRYYFAGWCCF